MASKASKDTAKVLSWRQLKLSVRAGRISGFHSVTAAGRYLFVFGSHPQENYTTICSHVFDRQDKKWSELTFAVGPCQRYGHSATLVDDKIYLFGGKSERYLNDLHAYDISLNAWTECDADPKPPANLVHTAHYAESIRTILTVCGRTNNNKSAGQVYAYGIDMKLWTECKAKGIAPARCFHSSCISGTKIYVNGGYSPQRVADPKVIHIFDFSQGLRQCAWSSIHMKGRLDRTVHGAALVYVSDKRLLLLGGHSGYGSANDSFLYLYDLNSERILEIKPKGDTIRTTLGGPSLRRNFGCARLQSKILVFGGFETSMDPMYELDISALG